jgi:surface polysaccharide O-acyltransferase-like enzyme
MTKVQNKRRVLWADVVRITAIYFVVQIHTFPLLSHVQPYLYWPLSFLTKFSVVCVPLFVMLSGALLLRKEETYPLFFKKRIVKIGIPWIVWTVIYMAYEYYFHHDQVIQESSLHFFIRMFLSNLWFLPLIFSLYLLTPLFRIFTKYAKKVDYVYLLSIWFLFISLMPFLYPSALFPNWEPNLVLAPIQYSGYFLLGYFLIKYKILVQRRLLLLLALSILPILFNFIPSTQNYVQHFASGFLSPGTVIASIFFFTFLVSLSNKMDKKINKKTKNIIVTVSNAIFGVYLIQAILIFIIGDTLINYLHPLNLEFLTTLLIFSLSTLIVILIQKIPLVKHIVP